MIEGVRRGSWDRKSWPRSAGRGTWTNPNEMSMCKAWEPDRSRSQTWSLVRLYTNMLHVLYKKYKMQNLRIHACVKHNFVFDHRDLLHHVMDRFPVLSLSSCQCMRKRGTDGAHLVLFKPRFKMLSTFKILFKIMYFRKWCNLVI